MFSADIVGQDAFLDMPTEAQLLYFHLGMYADDEGFVSPKKVMRLIGAGEDNIKLLVAKNFVIPFESGVVVVTHWRQNNYIQSDRFTPSTFQKEKGMLSCIHSVYILDTQGGREVRELGKKESSSYLELKAEMQRKHPPKRI